MSKSLEPINVSAGCEFMVCRMVKNDGASREFEVKKPVIATKDFSKFIETININDGIILNITNMPKGFEFDVNVRCEGNPICIGCHLAGDMLYIEDGNPDPIHYTKDTVFITKAFHYLATKRNADSLKGFGILFYPGAEKLIFGDSAPLMKDKYRALFDDFGKFVTEHYKAPLYLKAIAESIVNCKLVSHKREFYIRSKAIEFLNCIFSEYMMRSERGAEATVLQPGEVKKIKMLRDYINSNMDRSLTISQLSKMSGLNDCKLKAGFKEVYGTTIHRYITSEKMSKAKLMLETGRYSVSEIAWDIGYTNVSHFIKSFKKCYRVTPGQMLIQIKNDISRHEISHI